MHGQSFTIAMVLSILPMLLTIPRSLRLRWMRWINGKAPETLVQPLSMRRVQSIFEQTRNGDMPPTLRFQLALPPSQDVLRLLSLKMMRISCFPFRSTDVLPVLLPPPVPADRRRLFMPRARGSLPLVLGSRFPNARGSLALRNPTV